MSEERPLLEELADYLLYAPIGLAITITEAAPELIERGRERVAQQLGNAQVIGKLSIEQLRRRVGSLIENVVAPDSSADASSAPPQSRKQIADPETSAARRSELAIPEYDALAASQVVTRLDGLSPDELEGVRVYESEARGRRTVLSRIEQLQFNGELE